MVGAERTSPAAPEPEGEISAMLGGSAPPAGDSGSPGPSRPPPQAAPPV